MKGKSNTVKKILVVDNKKIVSSTIANILLSEGYKTYFAYDGKTALLNALTRRYDLVLLNTSLPDLDGFEVCKRLRGLPKTASIPVIFISSLKDLDNILQKSWSVGTVDYLRKPFTTSELLFTIKKCLTNSKTEIKLRQNEILFRSIVNDQLEYVVRYKPDGTLTFVNTAFCHFLDKNVREVIGSNFFDQLNIERGAEIRSRLLQNEITHGTDIIEIKKPGGEVVWHQWVHRLITDKVYHNIVIQSIGRDITESKKNEDILRKFEYIFKYAGWGIVANDPKSLKFELVNEAYARMHGYKAEELVGEKISTLFEDGSDKLVQERFDIAMKNGHYSYETSHKRKSGETFPCSSELTIMKDEDGNDSLLIANVQDLSETEKVSRALIESEERFRTIFMSTPDIIVILRLDDLTIVDVNDKFLDLTKIKKNRIIGKPNFIFKFFENKADIINILNRLRKDQIVSNIEVSLKAQDRHFYPSLMSCSKILLNGISHIVAIVRNIEDIRLFKESLRNSETKYRLLADHNYNWEFWLSPDGNYIYTSPSCERLSGFKPRDFEEYPDLMLELIHPEFKSMCTDHFKTVHRNPGPEASLEFIIIDRYGNEKWISHNCNAVFDETGAFAGRRGNNSDITQRKISELELHKLSTAIEQSSSAIVITDLNGDIEYVNPYFEKLTGFKYKEVLGKKPSMLKSGRTDPKLYEELWTSISSGKIWEGEFINKKKNGELFTEHAIITPVKDKSSRIVNFIAIMQDITKQKEIDRKILQTIISTEEKERTRFAQDLHDDLGPLLSTAKLYIKSLETSKDQKNKQTAIDKSLEAIDESLLSIKEIAYDLSPHVLRNFGLISGIKSLINKINETGTLLIEFNSEIEERLDENIESSVFRILSELINNTIKHAHANRIVIDIKIADNEVFLSYSDDGIGFNLEKALEKRFSRGLSNIMNRVKSLGGEIAFSNDQGIKVLINAPLKN